MDRKSDGIIESTDRDPRESDADTFARLFREAYRKCFASPLTAPLTTPDGGAGGDTWANYAQGFFAMYCTRCHSSTLSGDARNGAPVGYDWDLESAVHARLDFIRSAVGVGNFMPPSDPKPSCEERRRIVRWIDADAP